MEKRIAALTRDPHTVSLIDRNCSLFIDQKSGSIFVDEGEGEGRVNGVVFTALNNPTFSTKPSVGSDHLLVLDYRGIRFIVGTSNEGVELIRWAESANLSLAAKRMEEDSDGSTVVEAVAKARSKKPVPKSASVAGRHGMTKTNGAIYPGFIARQGYDAKAQACVLETVTSLLTNSTTTDKPGMLLGKIQSGKTRTFLGVTALAFDNGFDVVVVLTKGTNTLAQQTLSRLNKDFKTEIDGDLLHVFDVMSLPQPLAEYELQHKLIFVCKKEDDNLRRLDDAIFHTNPSLASKRILLIDDEADYASIGFRRTKAEGLKINKIARQLDAIRQRLEHVDILQVTATPYSLYLQPETITLPATQETFLPVRPAFTTLVPIHDKYIGGEYYFEESQEQDTIASYLHVNVDPDELTVLKAEDRRRFKIEECLTSPAIQALRRAIITFIVGGYIRQWQEMKKGKPRPKFSFIVHTETKTGTHDWQERIVREIIDRLKSAVKTGDAIVRQLVDSAHADLSTSVELLKETFPTDRDCVKALGEVLPMVNYTRVNFEKDVLAMLDDSGQLKLRTPFNIFIGGQILDRGLTIANLIGFFYGRSPKKFQQDTVLQHSRMYGVRPVVDLAVTRFYTTLDIYSAMRNIHMFDSALRKSFEQGGDKAAVVFIRKDPAGGILPCSPNKILLSTVTTVSPGARFLPVGFTTDAKTRAMKHIKAIDDIVQGHAKGEDSPPFVLKLDEVEKIIEHIEASLVSDPGFEWDVKAFKATLEHLAKSNAVKSQRGEIMCLVRRDRKIAKTSPGGKLQNAPDSKTERTLVEEVQGGRPAFLLYRQNGKEEQLWSGCPFWWPVLRAPITTPTVIFASDTVQ
jgi:hypothetical protein